MYCITTEGPSGRQSISQHCVHVRVDLNVYFSVETPTADYEAL